MSIIIIGAGKIGQFIASKLSSENKDVVLIDNNEDKAALIGEDLDVEIIHGNGASPTVLKEAGIKKAEMLLAVTDSDEVNLLSCMISNLHGTKQIKVARVRNPEFYDIHNEDTLQKLQIDKLINPDKEAADAILRIISVPGSVDVLNFFDKKMQLVGVRVKEETDMLGKALEDLNMFGRDNNMLFTSIIRDGETITPSGKDKILVGDLIYFVSSTDNVGSVMKHFGYKHQKIKRVMINGGTYIGLYLAEHLEKNDIQVKLIEPDGAVCASLVNKLQKTVVLNDSGTEQNVLVQEGISNMDAFISTTKDDEENALSSLLAKRLGAAWTISCIAKSSYMPLISAVGVDVGVSPRTISISAILHFIRKGKVLSVASVQEGIEILEIEASESSNIVGTSLKKAKIPKGALIIALERDGNITIPHGDSVIKPGDRVLIQTNIDVINKVEKLFAAKSENA